MDVVALLKSASLLVPEATATAAAAEELRLERSAAWCRWREGETRNGVIRADLTLRAPSDGGRRSPADGAGVLRPMWNIGNSTPAGEPEHNIALIWVEDAPALEPGGRATVRLAPLTPRSWRHLEPGQVITMHETRTVAGTAVVLQADFRHTEMCFGES
ncbi:hypothetical protein [Streptomyces albogriseolus]|uniref:hypothetical protein n=1 Tax=Streptomyces albogriseolus TaxID=1887 RepID=UPI003809E25F